MNTNTAFDLAKLYKTYFNNAPYFVNDRDANEPLTQSPGYNITTDNPSPKGSIDYSSKTGQPFNKIGAYGQAIWFPIQLYTAERQVLEIEACTVAVNLTKTIIRTAVSERQGTVKECFSIDDYKFTVKGFLIGKDRLVPEDQILALKDWFETTDPIALHGGYVELFMNQATCRVAVSSLDFPEVQGKATWIRPFTMSVETDFIDSLKV